uniref:Uncharacterized protein n=1 Tax=Arundo donax TaxID=35708 RepID=A0A0A9CAK6_ARUDO
MTFGVFLTVFQIYNGKTR